MFGNLTSLRLTSRLTNRAASQLRSWSLDRDWDRTEGERLLKARSYALAEVHLSKAAVAAETRGLSATKRVHLRLELAEAQRRQFRESGAPESRIAKLKAAEKTVRSAIEVAARTGEQNSYVECLDALAEIFTDQEKFTAVEKVIQEAIRIEVTLPRPDPVRMARRVLRLGISQHKNGRTEEAIPALQKALKLHEETYGEDHRETGNHLTEMGAVYRANGNQEEAQKCFRRALRIHQREFGMASAEAIRDLHHLAGSLEDQGDLEAAAAEYERALSFKMRSIGGSLEDFAELQFGLAGLYIKWQHYSRARELIYEAIGFFKRKVDVRLAVTHETLAHVEECSGRYPDALKELALAGKVWQQLADRTGELIRNMEHRAELLDLIRKKGEAAFLREKIQTLAALEAETAQVL